MGGGVLTAAGSSLLVDGLERKLGLLLSKAWMVWSGWESSLWSSGARDMSEWLSDVEHLLASVERTLEAFRDRWLIEVR